jgi:hypothetical protein
LVIPKDYVQWHTRNLHRGTVQCFPTIVDRGVFIPERENWLNRVQSFLFSYIRERPFTSLLLPNSLFFNLYLFVSNQHLHQLLRVIQMYDRRMADSQNHRGHTTKNDAHNLRDNGNKLRNDFNKFQDNGKNPKDR